MLHMWMSLRSCSDLMESLVSVGSLRQALNTRGRVPEAHIAVFGLPGGVRDKRDVRWSESETKCCSNVKDIHIFPYCEIKCESLLVLKIQTSFKMLVKSESLYGDNTSWHMTQMILKWTFKVSVKIKCDKWQDFLLKNYTICDIKLFFLVLTKQSLCDDFLRGKPTLPADLVLYNSLIVSLNPWSLRRTHVVFAQYFVLEDQLELGSPLQQVVQILGVLQALVDLGSKPLWPLTQWHTSIRSNHWMTEWNR